MASHDESCSESGKLCDHLYEGLRAKIGSLTREEGRNWCSLRGGGKIFAYVWHSTRQAWVNVWFRGSAAAAASFTKVAVHPRNPTSGTWKKFGGSFKVYNNSHIEEAVELLSSVSHPSSLGPH